MPIRGRRYHVRTWGDEGLPPLFLLHGEMDLSASYQFAVEMVYWRKVTAEVLYVYGAQSHINRCTPVRASQPRTCHPVPGIA